MQNNLHTMQSTFPPGMVFPGTVVSMDGSRNVHKRTAADAGLHETDDDSDDQETKAMGIGQIRSLATNQQSQQPCVVPGKKTKGRVKIKMEFIDNKLRRYTTFSKRKTGIMKKAYELSTLTGTQVMLLVASETGHVYTFATRKLQPMITSETGKALIQTCLNSPDVPLTESAQQQLDQRMSATGFEETDLTYAVSEEEAMSLKQEGKQYYTMSDGSSPSEYSPTSESTPQPAHSMSNNLSTQAYSLDMDKLSNVGTPTGLAMKLPTAAGFTVLAPGGTPLQLTPIPTPPSTSDAHQNTSNPPPLMKLSQTSQALNLTTSTTLAQNVSSNNSSTLEKTQQQQQQQQQQALAALPLLGGNLLVPSSGAQRVTSLPPAVMYQTAQGVMYAAPSTSLPEGVIFNLQQPGLSLQHQDEGYESQQQQQQQQPQHYITIPVPVSLANSQLLQSLVQTSVAASMDSKKSPISAPKTS